MMECDYLYGWIFFKKSHTQKSHPNWWNPKDIAIDAEEEETWSVKEPNPLGRSVFKQKGAIASYLNAFLVPIGRLPIAEHLPQRDAKAPHIAGVGEVAVVHTLWSIPVNHPVPWLSSKRHISHGVHKN